MKLIAKTQKRKEFLHSKENAFFVSDTGAEKICKILNDVKFRINNSTEVWHVYDYDWSQESYVTHRLFLYRGKVKLKSL